MAARSLPGWRAWVAIATGLVGLYAVLGFFVLPPIARSQIVKRARTNLHRKASVARVRFNPFTLTGVVEGLELKDRDGAPLFKVDRFAADLELSGLFRRAWRFREIAVDGPRLHARILDDGRPSVADLFEPDAARPRERKAGLPRVIVDRFVLRRGRAEFTDESRSPDFIQALEPLDLELHDLITIPEESGDHVVTIGLGKDSLVRWSGKQTVEPSHLEGRVEITGIALGRLWEYAAPGHPLTVSDGRADVVLAYDARRAADGSFAVAMKDATVKARGVIVRPRGGSEDWLEVPSAEVSGLEAVWPESRAEVAAVRVTDPRVLVRRDAGGKMNWAAAMPPAAAPKKEAAKPWTAAIDVVEVKGGRITLDDLAVSPGVKTVLSGVGVRLEKVSTDPSAPVKVEATAAINGSGQASLSGTVVRDPQSANLDVGITRLDLTPFQPYAVRLPGAKFRRGVAEVAGQLRVSPGKPRVQFDGSGGVNALQIAGAGEGRLFAWDRLRARGVRVTLSPDRVRVTEILVGGGFLKLRIDREGNVNLSKLGRPAGARTSSRSAPPATPAAMPVTIGKVVIKNATLDYTDESLILPFGTKIHSVNGGIRDISTAGAAPARLGLEGRVADAGYFKTDGTLRVAAPFAATDVKVIFRNVNMPDLTPYTAEFAGYSVEKGVLDVDVRYRVQDRHLVGDHRVVAKDLVLGPKVEGAKGPGLPVRLAVALLKDKDGRIDLEVPIEGTVDSPTFNYRAVFWQALKKILTNLVTAPFRAIGRLFGADKEDLELVGFASGRSDLPAPEQDKLAKMATELANRVEISLEVEGRFDPVIDADALRRARLEAKIDAKRTPDSNLDAILEAIYTETFAKEQLEARRIEFMPATRAAPPAETSSKKSRKRESSPPPPSREAFDAAAFYESLRKQLLEAEKVDESDLAALARARADAIAAALTALGGLDPTRVRVLDPARVKRKKQGSDFVASEMTMKAND